MDYKDKIRYIRTDILKMNREDFASTLDTKANYISVVENGRGKLGKIKESTLIKLANLPIDYFMDTSDSIETYRSEQEETFYHLFPSAIGVLSYEQAAEFIGLLVKFKGMP